MSAMFYRGIARRSNYDIALRYGSLVLDQGAIHSDRITDDEAHTFTVTNSSYKSPFLYNVTKQNLVCRTPKHYPTPRAFLSKLQPTLNPSCDKLFNGQDSERQRVRNATKQLKLPSDAQVLHTYMDCSFVQNDFDNNFYISQDEIDFPIAYEMLIYYHKNRFLQALNLLKFIYRPHNIYCIHIDKGSPQWWINSIKSFTSCLPNVFVAKKLVKIYYGSVSILDAHLSCLSELLTVTTQWKYVLTLHSPEIPLITNRDIVKKLMELKGNNIIVHGTNASDPISGNPYKWLMGKKVVPGTPPGDIGPLPNFTIYKSAESINSALSRDFVKYALTDSKSIALRKRLEYTQSGVEFFFATLNMLKDAPGNRMKLKAAGLKMPRFSQRFWGARKNRCLEGYLRHGICIVSASDLPFVKNQMKRGLWFYNKYLIDYDHVVNDCIQLLLTQNNFNLYQQECKNQSRTMN